MRVVAEALTARQTKQRILELVRQGHTAKNAVRMCGKSEETLRYYRKSDREWFAKLQVARGVKQRRQAESPGLVPSNRPSCPDFPEFCEEYLGINLSWHQLQWFDLLEGREPRELHPSQKYVKGESDLILINTAPEHAKSQTISVAYVVWRICKDPNDLVLIVSKTQEMAKKFLYAIKNRLTHPNYRKLQQDFGPPEGFDKNTGGWTQDRIYISDVIRDSMEKDPTVQALGIKGHIYGSRARLIILDDAVDDANAYDWSNQIDWISGEVVSRVGDDGKILIIGTRVAPQDLYKEILKADHFADEGSPWTMLTQPVVLEDGDTPEQWKTLWPRSNRPLQGSLRKPDSDGMYPTWDGPALARKKRRSTPRVWALKYMQADVQEDAIFPLEAIRGCTNGNRTAGVLQADNPYHRRKEGMGGLHILAGLDPAVTGKTGAIVIGLDRTSGKRYVLDVYSKQTRPDEIFELMRAWTDRYQIVEWRVEKNAMNLMITQNGDIRRFLAARGCILSEHYTSSNKWDHEFGVASMSSLFDGWNSDLSQHRALVDLPSQHNHSGVRQFVEELSVWYPGIDKHQPTDTVMAFWFAEIRCRELCNTMFDLNHWENDWLTKAEHDQQVVIDINELESTWV